MLLHKQIFTLLTVVITFTTAAPILTFPIPSVGTDIIKFAESFVAFFATLVSDDNRLPIDILAPLIPNLGNDLNFAILEAFAPDVSNYNNYGVHYPVKGLDDEQSVWLVEAVNRTEDDPVILYSHGGAYLIGEYPFFHLLNRYLYEGAENDRLSIILLDYTLSSNRQTGLYPGQLNEISLLYNSLAKTSNNIILAGDSAGGHLSLSLFRHIEYPVDEVPQVDQKPTGALLFSPWVNVGPREDVNGGTYITNKYKDILNADLLHQCGEYWTHSEEELYSPALNPYNDTEVDWSSILPKSSKVFVAYGENEVLKSDILKFAEIADLPSSQLFQDPDAIHDPAIFTPDASATAANAAAFLKNNF